MKSLTPLSSPRHHRPPKRPPRPPHLPKPTSPSPPTRTLSASTTSLGSTRPSSKVTRTSCSVSPSRPTAKCSSVDPRTRRRESGEGSLRRRRMETLKPQDRLGPVSAQPKDMSSQLALSLSPNGSEPSSSPPRRTARPRSGTSPLSSTLPLPPPPTHLLPSDLLRRKRSTTRTLTRSTSRLTTSSSPRDRKIVPPNCLPSLTRPRRRTRPRLPR
jgi:hypothetical protein